MEWTHLACMAAGGLLGSFLMAVWQNERRHRRERQTSDLYCDMFIRGRWFPPAKSEPPPAPPAPPRAAL